MELFPWADEFIDRRVALKYCQYAVASDYFDTDAKGLELARLYHYYREDLELIMIFIILIKQQNYLDNLVISPFNL